MSDPTMEWATDSAVMQRGLAEDKHALDCFHELMLEKLRDNRHKAHWEHVSQDWILARLEQELEELKEALANGCADDIAYECADVANFAMMIADNERDKNEVR